MHRWSICSVTSDFIVAPGYSEEWNEDQRKCFVIEVEESITVRKRNKYYLLNKGTIAVGNAMTIINDTKNPAKIKVIVLRCTKTPDATPLFFFNDDDSNHQEFINLVRSAFSRIQSDNSTIYDINEYFNDQLKAVINQNLKTARKKHGKIDPRLIWVHRM